jgi:hypothetical protein
LRWWDTSGNLLLWGKEFIEQERQRAEQERQRADQAESQLRQEQVMRQRLTDRLKTLGIDTDLSEE